MGSLQALVVFYYNILILYKLLRARVSTHALNAFEELQQPMASLVYAHVGGMHSVSASSAICTV